MMALTVTSSEWLAALAAIAAVVVGWCLNELSLVLRVRREDRRSIGRALSELMEIRHDINGLPQIIEALKKKMPIPAEVEPILRTALANLFPGSEALQKRYNDAVTSVAGRFPILAFELRSKDVMRPLFRQVGVLFERNPDAQPVWSKVEDKLVARMNPVFDDLILRLAWRHGLRTWWDARSRLRAVFEMPGDFDEIFSELTTKAQEAASANAGRVVPNSGGGPAF